MQRIRDCALFCSLIAAALIVSACGGGSSGGGCQLPGSPPSLAGTYFPTQPIPAGANVPATVSVGVKVVIDKAGNLVSANVSTSSGNAVIDQAALSLIRQSKFLPGFPGCGNSAPNTSRVFFVTYSPNV